MDRAADNRVDPPDACPNCGERDADRLVWDHDGERVTCASCGTVYEPPRPGESFAVEDGLLVRRVVPRRGKPYEHRCPLRAYEAVAHAVDETAGEPFTGERIVEATGLPSTQVFTALGFLKERGCVVPALGRRHKAAPGNAGGGVHLDAMIEYHALREKGAE